MYNSGTDNMELILELQEKVNKLNLHLLKDEIAMAHWWKDMFRLLIDIDAIKQKLLL